MKKATRVQRLIAAVIDGLVVALVLVPILLIIGGNGGNPSFLYTLFINILVVAIFFIINWKFLIGNGQTVGKKIMNIKIVKSSGDNIDKDTIIKRYGLYYGLGLIPFIGALLSLINILLIFREDIRCGHDLFADTIVVMA